jgi:transcriptional regulator with XRE-family HTH domain
MKQTCIPQLLKAELLRRHINLASLARKLNLKPQTFYALLSGKKEMHVLDFLNICAEAQIRPSDVIKDKVGNGK